MRVLAELAIFDNSEDRSSSICARKVAEELDWRPTVIHSEEALFNAVGLPTLGLITVVTHPGYPGHPYAPIQISKSLEIPRIIFLPQEPSEEDFNKYVRQKPRFNDMVLTHQRQDILRPIIARWLNSLVK